ncbi:phasin family protein [Pelagibius marinus]|uniref:phasin family protein n=1 Tax=Pelagibius marinus TaxID=2762760 RepID=UPI0018728B68|nr:phasin family protein [Pelagibius marinus]
MPSKPKKQGATGAPAAGGLPTQGFESLVEANAKAAEIWLESWAKLAGESAGFVTRRWQQDMDLIGKICACKSPVELLQLQSEFMQRALVDYMKEATRLGDMETDAGVSELEALDEGVREAGEKAKGGKSK